MSKKDVKWKTKIGKCVCCHKCKIYTEGPMIGRCIYGGPFRGYCDEDGNDISINIEKQEIK